jgi:prepilin-type N-terminal cleavage/methylation domain-containing protein
VKLRRARKRSNSGFTLVELMVSMVAGLIVAMAVVGISRDATNTFHEETRVASAEMNLRTAVDRIRLDVQRASFMSSANIANDPLVPLNPAGARPANPARLANLSGLVLTQDATAAATPQSLRNAPLLPERLDLYGNYTTADQFAVRAIDVGAGCGGPRLHVSLDSAAMYRVLASSDPAATFRNLFQPAPGQFFVRVVDNDQGISGRGRTGYFRGCANGTGVLTATGAFVELDNGETLPARNFAFNFSVNPVVGVRWELRSLNAATESESKYAALVSDGGTTGPKYDLLRQYLDASDTPAGSPEVVAEYAVDLAFAFSADIGTPPVNTSWNFGATNNATTAAATLTGAAPQRIRSVRIRLSTRAAQADRENAITLPTNMGGGTYPIRYCINPLGCNSSANPPPREWARMRTVITEVALPNQARISW